MCEVYVRVKPPLWKIHYGHWMRDFMLPMFWYMHKTKILYQENLKLYFHKRGRGDFHGKMKDFMDTIFPYTEYWGHRGHAGKNLDDMLHYMERPFPYKKFFNCWGGDEHFYPKMAVNKFRDYCFKKLNHTPVLENVILYAPRKENELTRCLVDEALEKQLKKFATENNYSFVKWINDDKTIIEQIQAYSQAKIIIGCTGSDFANGYWTNKDQLIIEIIPNNHYPGLSGWAYSPDVISHSTKKWKPLFESARAEGYKNGHRRVHKCNRYGDTYLPIPSHKRNWNYVYLREENEILHKNAGKCCYGRPRDRHDLFTSQDHRDNIQKIMNDFIV